MPIRSKITKAKPQETAPAKTEEQQEVSSVLLMTVSREGSKEQPKFHSQRKTALRTAEN